MRTSGVHTVYVHKLFLVTCCPAWCALPVGRQDTGSIIPELRPFGLKKVRAWPREQAPLQSQVFLHSLHSGERFSAKSSWPAGHFRLAPRSPGDRGAIRVDSSTPGLSLVHEHRLPMTVLVGQLPSPTKSGRLPSHSAIILCRKTFL